MIAKLVLQQGFFGWISSVWRHAWKAVSSWEGSMLSVLILCSGAEWAWNVMRSTGEGAPSSRLSVPFPAQSNASRAHPPLSMLGLYSELHCTLQSPALMRVTQKLLEASLHHFTDQVAPQMCWHPGACMPSRRSRRMPWVAVSSCSRMGPLMGSIRQPSSSTSEAALYWPMPAHALAVLEGS